MEANSRIARLEALENRENIAPDQNSAIWGMVSRLETRLADEGGSAENGRGLSMPLVC